MESCIDQHIDNKEMDGWLDGWVKRQTDRQIIRYAVREINGQKSRWMV